MFTRPKTSYSYGININITYSCYEVLLSAIRLKQIFNLDGNIHYPMDHSITDLAIVHTVQVNIHFFISELIGTTRSLVNDNGNMS